MPDNFLFNLYVGFKFVKRYPLQSLKYFLMVSTNYILISIFFVGLININILNKNYLSVFKPGFFNIVISMIIDNYYILYIVIIFIMFFLLLMLVNINKNYLKIYFKYCHQEIILVKKLKGNINIISNPIIYLGIIINFLCLIIIYNLTKKIYVYLIVFVNLYSKNLKFLEFTKFDTFFVISMLFITLSTLIFTTHYLFWNIKR